ncbi:MAG: C10 family peptidase, partial [Bacteroidales bacterium]|nr:C10 family peptidase [Bacteroidales bacterium]
MKNLLRIALLTFTLLFSAYSFGNAINKDIAMQIANNFYLEMFADRINNIYDDFEIKLAEIRTSGGHDLLYIYNLHDEGFLILSAWDGTIPVLGFSTERAIELSAKDLPPGFAEIIKNYESEILYAINHNLEANSEISEQWKKWLNPSKALQDDSSVSPLLSTAWNQSCYYNALCPEDEASPNGYCGHVPAGCVALAMAQVMKYWNHPVSGSGSHSYSISPYGLQWADFENTTYQWENMPTNLGNSNTDVATLIYHCAVSVDMQFDPSGSGASTSLARNSLINYFGYNEEAQYFLKDNYQDSEWESMLRAELDIQRPVIYRGNGTGGHAWVCDGYAADNYFHMNWGWGGYANGYFYLSNLNPAGANFNNNQAAIMDIVPANASVEPPTNLQAQVSENDVLISWSAPQEPQWIHWDNGTNAGTISLDGGGSYYIAARWSTSDLELLDEAYISKVSFFLGSDAPGYVLKIWEGENTASLIYSQTLETITENSWNTVNLTNPLQIDASEELYIGLLI